MNTNNQNTALLVMDMQTAILRAYPDATEFSKRVAKAIANAHELNIPVLYIIVGFRPGMPEISINNKGFSASKERLSGTSMEE